MEPEFEKAAKGNGAAKRDPSSLFNTYQNYVFGIALSMTKNHDLAHDITQDVFIKFLEDKARVPANSQEKDIKNILRRVCTNHTLNVIRSNKIRSRHEKDGLKKPVVGSSPTEDLFEHQLLRQHLDKLDDKFRRPLLMRYFEGQKFDSIAKTLRVPVTTVQSRVRKGLRLLQSRLKKEGFVVALPALEIQLRHLNENPFDLAAAFYEKISHTLNVSQRTSPAPGSSGLAKGFLTSRSLIRSFLLLLIGASTTLLYEQPEILTAFREQISGKRMSESLRLTNNDENTGRQQAIVPQQLSQLTSKDISNQSHREVVALVPENHYQAKFGDSEQETQVLHLKSQALLTFDEENLKGTEDLPEEIAHSPQEAKKQKKDNEQSEPTNLPPVALAGPDQNLLDSDDDGQELVVLDGSESFDPDKNDLIHFWFLGDELIAFGAKAKVKLPLGAYEIGLWVHDNGNPTRKAYDLLQVTVSPPANNFPVAVPKFFVDQSDSTGQSILLDASASYDSDHDSLTTYTWVEVTNSKNPKLIYSGPSSEHLAQFAAGTHILELTVTDNGLPPLSGKATLSFTIDGVEEEVTIGQAPVADASFPPVVVAKGLTGQGQVEVDASDSHDADGMIVLYELFLITEAGDQLLWSGSSPQGEISLEVGTHQIKLCVTDNDGMEGEAVYNVTVTLGLPPTAIIKASVAPDVSQPIAIYEITIGETLYLNAWESSDEDGGELQYLWHYKLALAEVWTLGTAGVTYSFSISAPGFYHARLQVTDEQGNISESTVFVKVLESQE